MNNPPISSPSGHAAAEQMSDHGTDGSRTPAAAKADAVRDLNDAFRRSFAGWRLVLTPGVASLPPADRLAIGVMVRGFSAFTPDNDPYGEHDFGAITYGGERYFWKIDATSHDLTRGSPDPANPAVTTRVLIIMRADEY